MHAFANSWCRYNTACRRRRWSLKIVSVVNVKGRYSIQAADKLVGVCGRTVAGGFAQVVELLGHWCPVIPRRTDAEKGP
jgi:hypothetical protein